MRNTTIQWLAAISMCLLLAGCGEDGETTESTGVATPDGSGGTTGRAGRLQFSASSATVSESAGNATVTVTRAEGSDGAVSVRVASRDGTATQPQDYTAVSTTVTFAAGDSTAKTVTVPIVNDTTSEPGETLYLALSSVTGGASLGSVAELLVTITDDDVAAPAAPRAAMSAVYKQLRIDWTSVTGATSYRLLKDPTGSSGFTQVGADLPESARSADVNVIVHKEDWLNARYVIAACNAAGCTQSNALSAAGSSSALIGYLKASNTGSGDSFGYAVALSADGNTLAVGARFERGGATGINGNQVNDCGATPSTNCSLYSGAVYVYTRTGSAWSAPVYIKASNTGDYNDFGAALALSADGNTLAVGAPGEGSTSTGVGGSQVNDCDALSPVNCAYSSGAVYVFARSGTTWSQAVFVKAAYNRANTEFGSAVALNADGTVLAVGTPNDGSAATGIGGNPVSDCGTVPVNCSSGSGAAHVFTRTGSTWSASAYIKASNTDAYDYFGTAVAVSADGNFLAVGAPNEDSAAIGIGGNQVQDCASATPLNCEYSSGAVYLYSRSGGVWSGPPVYIKASNTDSYNYFGSAIALSSDGNVLAVGAPQEDGTATGVAGSQANDCDVAVPVNCAPDSGAAYIYSKSGSWSASVYVKASNTGRDNRFGASLALSGDGNTLVVGAPEENGSAAGVGGPYDNVARRAGAAYVFVRDAAWAAGSYVKSSNPDANDYFGTSVAANADGTTMAVGADEEQSPATGLNGNPLDDCEGAGTHCAGGSGAAYIY